MTAGRTANGIAFDSAELDRVERRFWADVWDSVPEAEAAAHGIELRRFGPIQARVVAGLSGARWINTVLGAGEPGAASGGHLAAALEWARSLGVDHYVPLDPGAGAAVEAEAWLAANGYEPGYGWMKFVRDPHPPRSRPPVGVELVELTDSGQAPFGMIVANAFELPAWAAALFAELPGRAGWRCYAALLDGTPQACAAMFVDGEVAEFGPAATLGPARGRGCQSALLRRRIEDAAEAGCRLLFVETGERVPDRPSPSYRNILGAGFEEAYVRPNWKLAASG